MELKLLGHKCPVCMLAVWAYRITRIYCSDGCKAEHHANTRNQIAVRVGIEESNRLAIFGESDYACAKINRGIKLFSRNLYYLDSVLGPEYNSFCGNIKEFKSQKFQLEECSFTTLEDGKVVYHLSNFKYWMDGENLHVERVFEGPKYNDSVVGRWLLEYPDLIDRRGYSETELANLKQLVLENCSIWRE